jgi:hypothetical protein
MRVAKESKVAFQTLEFCAFIVASPSIWTRAFWLLRELAVEDVVRSLCEEKELDTDMPSSSGSVMEDFVCWRKSWILAMRGFVRDVVLDLSGVDDDDDDLIFFMVALGSV